MKARSLSLAMLLLAVTVLVGVPAAAEVYTVTLNSGKTFLTRYQPREASFDPGLVTFLGDQGNQIAIARDEIKSVTSAVETRGYGLRINTTTVLLGYTANNGELDGNQGFWTGDNRQSFDIEQFVEPGQAGGGIPVFGVQNFGGNFNGNSGGGGTFVPNQPAPTPQSEPPPTGAVQ